MVPYPLRKLDFYKIRNDFASDSGYQDTEIVKVSMLVQYQKSISTIHDMIEIIHFEDCNTKSALVWRTRIENLYGHWQEYLEPIPNPYL